jgi:glutamate/aspartate transport system substrate-binding protein
MKTSSIALVLALAAAPALAQDLSGTLLKAKETKRLAIGFQEASIPFSYLDGANKPVGFAVDLCVKIAEAARKRINMADMAIEFVPVTSANRIPLMINGTIDLQCAATTNNADRQKQVAFTNTHFLSATRFASKKANNLNKIDDLKGKVVTAVAGSTNINQINKLNTEKGLGLTVLPAKDQLDAFLLLETDRAQAFVLDDVQLAVGIARSKTPDAFTISAEALSKPEPYGIMLRREDPQFKQLADEVTAAIYKSPEIEALYRKWFLSPVPPNNVNFNYPMPGAMKKAFANPSNSADPDAYAAE